MKNSWFFSLLVPVALCSCEQELDGEPIIAIDSVHVNRIKVMSQEEYLIPYNAEVKVFTSLYTDNGTLKSFSARVECDEEDDESGHLRDLIFVEDDVSDNGMTDLSEASLRFKDGVVRTKVQILTRVTHHDGDEMKLKLYLNAGHNGTKEEVEFQIMDKHSGSED